MIISVWPSDFFTDIFVRAHLHVAGRGRGQLTPGAGTYLSVPAKCHLLPVTQLTRLTLTAAGELSRYIDHYCRPNSFVVDKSIMAHFSLLLSRDF